MKRRNKFQTSLSLTSASRRTTSFSSPVVFPFADSINSVSFTTISGLSLVVDDSGTIISVLHIVSCVNESIISATERIIDGGSTIIVVPRITISIPHTNNDGTPTVIGGSETIIFTMEIIISGEPLEPSNQPVADTPHELSICGSGIIISAVETVLSPTEVITFGLRL